MVKQDVKYANERYVRFNAGDGVADEQREVGLDEGL